MSMFQGSYNYKDLSKKNANYIVNYFHDRNYSVFLSAVLKRTKFRHYLSLTFLEIKKVIPFAICHAKYIKFFGPMTSEKSVLKDSSSTLYRFRLLRKNSRRFPYGQYSIIIHMFELLPEWS